MDIVSMAKVLFDHVLNNRVPEVEKCFKVGDTASWRELITYEFHFHELDLNPSYVYILEVIPKLMAYEITSMTSFHMAALMGYIDLLLTLMEKDVPVDLKLKSGTTAFHLACFGGRYKCVEILKDVFRADVHLRDKYGWTALHYASTEGHQKVVQFLLDAEVDVNIRDQDGTTAAFRAQANNHDEVVALLCEYGAEDELLNVDDEEDSDEDARKKQIEMMYSKPKKTMKRTGSIPDENSNVSLNQGILRDKTPKKGSTQDSLSRRQSAPASVGLDSYVPSPKILSPEQSQTLPAKMKKGKSHGTIRRLLRRELRAVFGEDGYEFPSGIPEEGEEGELASSLMSTTGTTRGVSIATLQGIMREEMEKYKNEMEAKGLLEAPNSQRQNSVRLSTDYEDIYQTLGMPQEDAPSPPNLSGPDAPPLPPRNAQMLLSPSWDTNYAGSPIHLSPLGSTSAALKASIYKIAPLLGNNWKSLAHSLPIESDALKVMERIQAIEAKNPDSVEKQAAMALAEWRINKGSRAEVDDLILGLRKAGLSHIIPTVERVTQEFTA